MTYIDEAYYLLNMGEHSLTVEVPSSNQYLLYLKMSFQDDFDLPNYHNVFVDYSSLDFQLNIDSSIKLRCVTCKINSSSMWYKFYEGPN